MKIKPFATEQFFSLYEFNARYPLSTSDCETMSIGELLGLAEIAPGDFLATRLNYTESEGDPELREQIASEYNNASGENVVYLGAPVEGIFVAMSALLNPGDEVIAMRPAYDALLIWWSKLPVNSFHGICLLALRAGNWISHSSEQSFEPHENGRRQFSSQPDRLFTVARAVRSTG